MSRTAQHLSRRALVTGLLAGFAAPLAAGAPDVSLRPAPRPAHGGAPSLSQIGARLVERANLTGQVSYIAADMASGEILDARAPDIALPPASVVKAITALYALHRLGPDHRFRTRLLATGPVRGGRLEGDLILTGGGDPTLDTDGLAALVRDLRAAGVQRVAGRLRIHAGALPSIPNIDPAQPDEAGYNPTIAGLNLNFNRVHFGWERNATGYDVVMDARGHQHRPQVHMAQMQVVDRTSPVYTYENNGGRDHWTVSRGALGNGGSRWLPVRNPALYAAEVFAALARDAGIALPEITLAAPQARAADVMASHDSPPLTGIVEDMLRYSTNLTAEALGLAATLATGTAAPDLQRSARSMAEWARDRYGLGGLPRLVDHSGLGGDARITSADMLRVLTHPDGRRLRPLLRDITVRDSTGAPDYNSPLSIKAKTGTLNFVSGLGGYAATAANNEIAFIIIAADAARRDSLPPEAMIRPPGGRAWLSRARTLQQQLIQGWAEAIDS